MRKINYSKIYLITLLILFLTSLSYSTTFYELIKEKKWDKLKTIISDQSYTEIKNKFSDFEKVYFIEIGIGKVKYYLKKKSFAEFGFIRFKKVEEKYVDLKIKANFSDLKFITDFSKYPVKNKSIQIGDAKLTFTHGFFYSSRSMKRLFFFDGSFDIDIFPKGNIEEQKTLKLLYNETHFKISRKKGVFVFSDQNIKKLIDEEQPKTLRVDYNDSIFIDSQIQFIQNEYGIRIVPFNEYWYSPFSETLNVCIMKKSKSYYKYVYNRNNTPDTFLIDQNRGKHILNYNRIEGMKFSSFSSNKVKKIQLYIRLNPEEFKMWTTALLIFPEAANSKSFEIFENMKLHDFYMGNDNNLDYIKQGDSFHIIGKEFKDFSFYYSGRLTDTRKKMDMMKYKFNNTYGKLDDFIFFDNVNKFYPNPGNQFFESTMKISIPMGTNCLASGFLRSQKVRNNRKELIFKTDGTKGLTIVCGDYKKLGTVESKIPISIFGQDNVKISKYFKKREIKKSFNFLNNLYGKRDIESVNLLLRRWINHGGISYKGFIVFNVVKRKSHIIRTTMMEYYKSNPVFLTSEINRDNLVHELAHQWWGGIISWDTYKDVWITEGGSQFSSLLYLESILSKKKFRKIIDKLTKRVKKDSTSGPIIYGNRIVNITSDYNAYQSLIYNKSALVFFMLRDIIGEKSLFKRINQIFSKYLKKSLSTRIFIKELAGSDKENDLSRFLERWIYSREIPVVNYKIDVNQNVASIKFKQLDTDFVFPIRIITETEGKTDVKMVVIKNKEQEIFITQKGLIKNIKIEEGFAPIELNKI